MDRHSKVDNWTGDNWTFAYLLLPQISSFSTRLMQKATTVMVNSPLNMLHTYVRQLVIGNLLKVVKIYYAA